MAGVVQERCAWDVAPSHRALNKGFALSEDYGLIRPGQLPRYVEPEQAGMDTYNQARH